MLFLPNHLLLYSKFPNAGCLFLQKVGLDRLIGCLMSTIITIVNEGVANWEKWKQAIAETETFRTLSLIARETNNAVALLDLEGRITWINQAFTHSPDTAKQKHSTNPSLTYCNASVRCGTSHFANELI
jgi:hypothetical protein